jgi:hypothetical protein
MRQYLANRSLWLDEASLSLNIMHRTFVGVWRPLDYHQGAPIGFLLLQKLVVSLFGTSEYALRLFPLLAGLLSILLFYKLADKTILPSAVPLAVALFAISPSLIYYSSEVKQYSSDVLIAVLLWSLMVWAAASDWTPTRILIAGFIGSIALWLSHPAVFVLFGAGAVVLLTPISRKDWKNLRRASVVVLLWTLSFVLCYLLLLRKLSQNSFLLAYWQSNFMPFPPRNLSDVKWFEDGFFDFFSSSGGLRFTGLAGLVFLLGCVSLFKRSRELLFLLLSPAILVLLASAMHKYPFGSRLTLFLVPVVLLLMAEGAEAIHRAVGNRLALTRLVLFGLLLLDSGIYTLHRFVQPIAPMGKARMMPSEELRPVLEYVRAHLKPGDLVYVYRSTQLPFEYYSERQAFSQENVEIGVASGADPHVYDADLQRLSGHRIWAVFSHMEGPEAAEPQYLKFCLARMGAQLDSFARPGAETDLYNLTTAKEPVAVHAQLEGH